MTLYKNKYRVETTRLPGYDYASAGRYFITVCTQNRVPFLGKIVQGKMQLNANGTIVEQCWFDLPNHYPNLILDAFVVMPNHFHGIMIIDNSKNPVPTVDTGLKPVSTNPVSAPHGLFEFVRALKTFSSRRINEINNTVGETRWQSRFWDHIIRDDQAYHRIQHYIYNNPSSWENDSLKS
jgi:REP element-mobilizing transposase RayT